MKMVKAGIAYCALTNVALGMAPENMQEDKQDILAQAVALNRVPPTTLRRLVSAVDEAQSELDTHIKNGRPAVCKEWEDEKNRLQRLLDQAKAEETKRAADEQERAKTESRNSKDRTSQIKKVTVGGDDIELKKDVTPVTRLTEIFDLSGNRLKQTIYLMPKKMEHNATLKLLEDDDDNKVYGDDAYTLKMENDEMEFTYKYSYPMETYKVKEIDGAEADEGMLFSLEGQLHADLTNFMFSQGNQFRLGYCEDDEDCDA